MSISDVFAGRNSHRVDIPVIGDSATAGLFASQYANIWTQQLNTLIRARFPTAAAGAGGGMGWIPVSDIGATANVFPAWPINDPTGSSAIDLGPVRGCDAWESGGPITYTAPDPTTSVQPTYFDAFPAGEMSFAVNGVTVYTVSNTQTEVDIKAPSIPMTAGDVLTITLVSGVAAPTGLLHFAGDENSGITFHACGRSGWCAGTESGIGWNAPEDQGPSLNWAQALDNSFTNTCAWVIMLGGNDGSQAIGNRTAAQFQGDLEGLIATVRGGTSNLAQVPGFIVGEWEAQFRPWADPSGLWSAYYPAMQAAAIADGNCTSANLAATMPSAYTEPFPDIYYTGGGGHPNDSGELVIAQTLLQALVPAAALDGAARLILDLP